MKSKTIEMKHLSAKPLAHCTIACKQHQASNVLYSYSAMKWSNHKNAQYTQLHNVQ